MLAVKSTKKFKSDFKRMMRLGHDPELMRAVIEILAAQDDIPAEFRDHELEGEWAGVRDIHIEADWLLLYQISGQDLILIRTGTHEDLF